MLLFDTREQWLAYRGAEHRVSSTDVAAILGVSPFASPWSVYAAKVEGVGRRWSPAELADLERGHKWEGRILEDYTDLTGRDVVRPGIAIIVHDDHPWAIASPDGWVFDAGNAGADPDGGVEAKTSRDESGWGPHGAEIRNWGLGSNAIIPPYYATQVYWCLAITGLPWWDVAVAIPQARDFPEVRAIRVWRDAETQQALLDQVGAWRERHLVGGEAPPIDGTDACAASLRRRFPTAAREKRAATGEEEALILRLAAAKRRQREAETEADLVKNLLAERIGDAKGLTFGTPGKGVPGVTWVRGSGRSHLSASGVLAERPDLADLLARHTAQGEPYAYPKLVNLE